MQKYDRNGEPLEIGDRVEYFRVSGGDTGGEALGWKGGMPCTVRKFGGPAGHILLEHDERAPYPPPYDVTQEWGESRVIVKMTERQGPSAGRGEGRGHDG